MGRECLGIESLEELQVDALEWDSFGFTKYVNLVDQNYGALLSPWKLKYSRYDKKDSHNVHNITKKSRKKFKKNQFIDFHSFTKVFEQVESMESKYKHL